MAINLAAYVKIDGRLNKKGYLKIFQEDAITSGLNVVGPNFVFQQDNDPKHTSKLCQDFIKKNEREKVILIMEWPAQSPDLSPIEVWDELDRRVKNRFPTNARQLWEYFFKQSGKV